MFPNLRTIKSLRGLSPLISKPRFPSRRLLSTESDGKHSKLIVNFSLPHETLIKDKPTNSVKLQTHQEGEMGVYANHAAFIYTLKPGLVEIEGDDKNNMEYFVSSGFAVMHPDSKLDIFAAEACELDQIDEALAASSLNEQRAIAEGGSSEEAKDAKIHVEVCEAVLKSLKK